MGWLRGARVQFLLSLIIVIICIPVASGDDCWANNDCSRYGFSVGQMCDSSFQCTGNFCTSFNCPCVFIDIGDECADQGVLGSWAVVANNSDYEPTLCAGSPGYTMISATYRYVCECNAPNTAIPLKFRDASWGAPIPGAETGCCGSNTACVTPDPLCFDYGQRTTYGVTDYLCENNVWVPCNDQHCHDSKWTPSGTKYCVRTGSGTGDANWDWESSPRTEICSDGWDNDCDGKIDCQAGNEDPDCGCVGTPEIRAIDVYVNPNNVDNCAPGSCAGANVKITSAGQSVDALLNCDGYVNVYCNVTNALITPTAKIGTTSCTYAGNSGSWYHFKCGSKAGDFPTAASYTATCQYSTLSRSQTFNIRTDPDLCSADCTGEWASVSTAYDGDGALLGSTQRKNCCGDNDNRITTDTNHEYWRHYRKTTDSSPDLEAENTGYSECCDLTDDCVTTGSSCMVEGTIQSVDLCKDNLWWNCNPDNLCTQVTVGSTYTCFQDAGWKWLTAVPAETACVNSLDDNCNSEADYDGFTSGGISPAVHGDAGCPVGISDCTAPATAEVGESFTVECLSTVADVRSITATPNGGGGTCIPQNPWFSGNNALFTCSYTTPGTPKTVTCGVDAGISYVSSISNPDCSVTVTQPSCSGPPDIRPCGECGNETEVCVGSTWEWPSPEDCRGVTSTYRNDSCSITSPENSSVSCPGLRRNYCQNNGYFGLPDWPCETPGHFCDDNCDGIDDICKLTDCNDCNPTSGQCVNATPANANLCTDDDVGLLFDVERVLVPACSGPLGPKCEYICIAGWHYNASTGMCSPDTGDTPPTIDCSAPTPGWTTLFCDDFEDGWVNTTMWNQIVNGGTISEAGGILSLSKGKSSTFPYLTNKNAVPIAPNLRMDIGMQYGVFTSFGTGLTFRGPCNMTPPQDRLGQVWTTGTAGIKTVYRTMGDLGGPPVTNDLLYNHDDNHLGWFRYTFEKQGANYRMQSTPGLTFTGVNSCSPSSTPPLITLGNSGSTFPSVNTWTPVSFSHIKVECKVETEVCTDGWDNDCDGFIDLNDPDCQPKFGNITGWVNRSSVNTGIDGATVSIVAPPAGYSNVTVNGKYIIYNVPGGMRSVSASMHGYRSVTISYNIEQGENIINFNLTDGDCENCADWENRCDMDCLGTELCTAPTLSPVCVKSGQEASPGDWVLNETGTGHVLCCTGETTKKRVDGQATVLCPGGKHLVKHTNIVSYGGTATAIEVFVCKPNS